MVWRGRDLQLDRPVAIKRPHDHIAADPTVAARFRREGLAAASLSHPGVVFVYDAGEDEQGPFLIMEYVDGEPLSEVLRREGRLATDRAADIARQAARALDHAHRRGLIHRDVKPANILIDRQGTVKLTDFGIARSLESADHLTGTGTVIGTVAYLSPEQATGVEAGPGADTYGLGVVLYEMLTGRVPFEADTPVAVALAHQVAAPPLPSAFAPIPVELERLILRSLAKDPAGRPPSAGAVADELSRWQAFGESTGHPPPPAGPIAPAERPTAPTRPAAPGPSSTRILPGPEPSTASPPRAGLMLVVLAAILAVGTAAVVLGGAPTAGGRTAPTAPVQVVVEPAPATTSSSTTSSSTTTIAPSQPSAEGAFTDLEGIIADGVTRGDIDRKAAEELIGLVHNARDEWDEGDPDAAAAKLEDLDQEAVEAFEKDRISSRETLEEILGHTDLIRRLMGVDAGQEEAEDDQEEAEDDQGGPPGPPDDRPGKRGRP